MSESNKPIYVVDNGLQLSITSPIVKNCRYLTIFHNPAAKILHQQQLTELGARLVPTIPVDSLNLMLIKALEYIGQQGQHHLF